MARMVISTVLMMVFALAPLKTNMTVVSDEEYVSLDLVCELTEGRIDYVFWESQVSIVDKDAKVCIAQFSANDSESILQIDGQYYVKRSALYKEDTGTGLLSPRD